MAHPSQVSILVYHSVADDHGHPVSYLSLPVRLFERQLQYLRNNGFETVSLHQIYAYLRDGAALPPRPIALTFDDGYLDNWVFAFPLLKKYGMIATVFVTSDFVDPRETCRPTLADVWAGRVDGEALEWWGHLSWPELRAMEASGVFDVQSHTRTHGWSFVSDRIVDFHHPQSPYHWLDWNERPHEKYSWLTRTWRDSVPLGTPVYGFAPTLLEPRYFDDPGVARCAIDYVAEQGGPAFFARPQWRDALQRVVARYRAQHTLHDRREADDEYVARVVDEMASSKALLAERLDKRIDFLCWPCGDYTDRLQRLAIEECGYLATANVKKTSNRPGDDPRELRRIAFGQDYAGPWRQSLIFMNFCGNVNYYSGRLRGYPPAPIARRLMRVGRLLHAGSHRAS